MPKLKRGPKKCAKSANACGINKVLIIKPHWPWAAGAGSTPGTSNNIYNTSSDSSNTTSTLEDEDEEPLNEEEHEETLDEEE